MTQVTAAMQAITASTGEVKTLIDQVSDASRQQAQGIDQVSRAIAQMERVTHTTAATAAESASASDELKQQAAASKTLVARLAGLVDGGTAAATVGSAAKARAVVVSKAERPVASGASTWATAETPATDQARTETDDDSPSAGHRHLRLVLMVRGAAEAPLAVGFAATGCASPSSPHPASRRRPRVPCRRGRWR